MVGIPPRSGQPYQDRQTIGGLRTLHISRCRGCSDQGSMGRTIQSYMHRSSPGCNMKGRPGRRKWVLMCCLSFLKCCLSFLKCWNCPLRHHSPACRDTSSTGSWRRTGSICSVRLHSQDCRNTKDQRSTDCQDQRNMDFCHKNMDRCLCKIAYHAHIWGRKDSKWDCRHHQNYSTEARIKHYHMLPRQLPTSRSIGIFRRDFVLREACPHIGTDQADQAGHCKNCHNSSTRNSSQETRHPDAMPTHQPSGVLWGGTCRSTPLPGRGPCSCIPSHRLRR